MSSQEIVHRWHHPLIVPLRITLGCAGWHCAQMVVASGSCALDEHLPSALNVPALRDRLSQLSFFVENAPQSGCGRTLVNQQKCPKSWRLKDSKLPDPTRRHHPDTLLNGSRRGIFPRAIEFLPGPPTICRWWWCVRGCSGHICRPRMRLDVSPSTICVLTRQHVVNGET